MPTFNGSTLIITLDAGDATVDAKVDLYSDWKEWAKTGDNMKYAPAFDTVGGDPTGPTSNVSPFYFLRNDLGWRIRPAEENATITINGNLYPRVTTAPMLIPTIGGYTAFVQIERDASAVVSISGSGVTAQDKLDISAQVWADKESVDVSSLDMVADAANRLANSAVTMIVQTVDTAGFTPTTTQFECALVLPFTDHVKGRGVFWRTGDLTYHAARINAYSQVGGRGRLTVAAMPAAPAHGDTFVLV